MALFGPKDKDIPDLTQLFQLEFDALHPYRSELDLWLGRFRTNSYSHNYYIPPIGSAYDYGDAGVDPLMMKPPYSAFNDSILWDVDAVNLHWRKMWAETFALIGLIKRIMVSIADDDLIHYEDITELNKAYERIWPSPVLVPESPETPVRVGDIKWSLGSQSLTSFLDFQLIDLIDIALRKTADTPGCFRRCQQCSSVFLAERKDQLYCSRRCNNRAQTRRWRAREKSAVCSFKA